MSRVLLVTGARSLAAHPGAEAWARGLIHAALVGVDLLIVGDAPGPDAWAVEIAREVETERRHRYIARGPDAGEIEVWDTHPTRAERGVFRQWDTHSGGTHPLRRNEAMVYASNALRAKGADVRVLALLDGLKTDAPGRRATRGTEHTAGLAERAGIAVQREVWNG